jgi:hypothetical protein
MTASILQFPPFVVRLAAEVRSAAADFCNFPQAATGMKGSQHD